MPTASGPAEAAVAAAREAGFEAADAEVVNVGTHVLVRMGEIAARVTGEGPLASFAGDLAAELRVAAFLRDAGAPVLPPVHDTVLEHGGRRVTLWRWWAVRREDTPAEIGHALAECHRALAGAGGAEGSASGGAKSRAGGAGPPASGGAASRAGGAEGSAGGGVAGLGLRPWAKLSEARERCTDARLLRFLGPPDVPLVPVHGDAHAGNVLPGPVWHDWEDAQLGCVEWDLACLVAPGRVVGGDFGYGEEILAGYDAPCDPVLLDTCVAKRTAQQAVYGLLLGDTIPGLPERVAARLEWLSRWQ